MKRMRKGIGSRRRQTKRSARKEHPFLNNKVEVVLATQIQEMKMLKPKFAILDEIDSGLDGDSLKVVGEQLLNKNLFESDDNPINKVSAIF